MKRWLTDAFALVYIAAISLLIVSKLFFPTLSLIVTPDFGHSDAWHLSFSGRYLLSQSLKQHTLPWWTPQVGGGFPTVAEGQTSVMYPANLLLFSLFSPVLAYNLSFFVALVLFGWGMYWFLRKLSLSVSAALFGGLTAIGSGIIITHFTHIALLEGLSLMPWVLVTAHGLLHPTAKKVALFALVVACQLFSGFAQATFLSLLFALGYILLQSTKRWHSLLAFGMGCLLAFGLAAIQLVPTTEFISQTTTPHGFDSTGANAFSYPFKHLITFINPFALGNPKEGTYPAFSLFDGSIFWENSGYIGLIPLMLIPTLLIFWKRLSKNRQSIIICFFIALGLSFFLMLGKHSPLYFVSSFWPFNLFRVPSRFLWVFVLSLIVVASIGWDELWQRATLPFLRISLIGILILHVASLVAMWWQYHGIEPATTWTTRPAILSVVSPQEKIFTIGDTALHNASFLANGWDDLSPYVDLRNTLSPNSALVWDRSTLDVFAGRALYRPNLVQSLLASELTQDDHVATLSATGQKLLDLQGVTTIIATIPVEGGNIVERATIPAGLATLHVYHNPTSLPYAYLAAKPVVATTGPQAKAAFEEDLFVPGTSALTEQPFPAMGNQGTVAITKRLATEIQIGVTKHPQESVLVVMDTYYPGWKATIDNKPAHIYPVNINQKGIVVPSGDHTVILTYAPVSRTTGRWVSIISIIVVLGAFLFEHAARLFPFVPVQTLQHRGRTRRT